MGYLILPNQRHYLIEWSFLVT